MPKKNTSTPENTAMRADAPISPLQLAELACTLYRSLAPQYNLTPPPDWHALSPAQQECAIAVATRLLRRVDARMRYVLRGTTANGPLVGKEACIEEEVTHA